MNFGGSLHSSCHLYLWPSKSCHTDLTRLLPPFLSRARSTTNSWAECPLPQQETMDCHHSLDLSYVLANVRFGHPIRHLLTQFVLVAHSVSNHLGSLSSKPLSFAIRSASDPETNACGHATGSRYSSLASRTGCRTCLSKVTPTPRRTLSMSPSFISFGGSDRVTEASISCSPTTLKTAPRPALNSGQSSKTVTATVAASRAVPPADKILFPASKASRSASRYF